MTGSDTRALMQVTSSRCHHIPSSPRTSNRPASRISNPVHGHARSDTWNHYNASIGQSGPGRSRAIIRGTGAALNAVVALVTQRRETAEHIKAMWLTAHGSVFIHSVCVRYPLRTPHPPVHWLLTDCVPQCEFSLIPGVFRNEGYRRWTTSGCFDGRS